MNKSIGVVRRLIGVGCGLAISALYLAQTIPAPSLWENSAVLLLGLFAASGVFLLCSAARLGIVVIVPSIIAALLLSLSIPVSTDVFPDVSITATGQKNPKSNSSEVYVRLATASVYGVRDFEGDGWEKRGEVYVSYQKQPSVLHYRGAWSSGAALHIVRHPYSGIAEVNIDGVTQRIDLFSESENSLVVPLPNPETTVSWKGYLVRGAIAVGFGLIFTALGIGLVGASVAWGGVFLVALMVGCGTLWVIKDRSYVGLLEIVAFTANSEPAKVEMDAGHGFTKELTVPVRGGVAIATEFSVSNPSDWQLGIEGGNLRTLRNLDVAETGRAGGGTDNGCSNAVNSRCIYEVQGIGPVHVWLEHDGDQKVLLLPPAAESSERLFLFVERAPGRIFASASRAYVQLSPWEHFSQWITALRFVGQDGVAASKLVRVMSEDTGGYHMFAAEGAHGAFRVPAVVRPDTGSFVGMKIFGALVSVSFVLLLAVVGKIAMTLAQSYRDGRRTQVLASVLGCIGWLGFAMLAGWPAIIGWDGFSPYIQAQTGQITLWYGIGYPLIIGGFLLLGSGTLITVWSVLVTTVLLLGAAALLLRRGSVAAGWVAPTLLCAVLPFTILMLGMMTHLRDTMNGLILAMFAFSSFYAVMKWSGWAGVQRGWVLAMLLVGGGVLVLVRIDNLPMLLLLAVGLTITAGGFNVRKLAVIIIAAASWIGITGLVEPYVVSDRIGAATEKRLYGSTAVINPLTGMLVYGQGRIPEALYSKIHSALDTVMDVDVAVQHWSPYHIKYWHETIGKRDVPTVEVAAQLQSLYLRTLEADPALFLKLRLATFSAMLGHDWFELRSYPNANNSGHPVFFDHLLNQAPGWKSLSEILGYSPTAHIYPELVQALLDWAAKIASSTPQLIVCIFVALRFRHHPLTAVVATGELVRAGVFFFFAPASVFLYLYDMQLIGFLLPMMVLAEQSVRAGNRIAQEGGL